MSPLRIYGSTSGYTEITPNSVAPNNTLTLPSTGSSLVSQDASGNISISGILTATNFVGNLTGTATGLTGTPNIVLGIATVSAGTTSAPAITPTGDSNTGIFFPSADTIAFAEGGVEAARFDSSGRLLIGTSTTRTFIGGAIYIPLQVEGANNNYSRGAALTYGIAGTPGPLLCLAKHRSNSVGGSTVVASGDELGGVVFHGSDGTNLLQSASIYSYSDGTPGTNDMPGRLVFSTTADGASTPTERARIDSSGRLLLGTSTARSMGGISAGVFIEGTVYNSLSLNNNTNDAFSSLIAFGKSRGSSVGSNTIVSPDDRLGGFTFYGTDGANLILAGLIECKVDGTPGSNDMPGRLVFSTTADGASGSTEAMRITQSGVVSLSGDPTGFYDQNPVKFGVNKTSSSGECLVHIRGHSGNGAGANTYALRVSSNADAANANSAALRIDHTNPLGGTGGPLIQAFGNLGNSTTQKLWEVFSYGQQMINRPSSDGTLIEFQQAQTVEGSISVSGTTVSYNGAHLSRWSQLINIDPHDKTQRPEILRGTIMSNLDEMCEWIDPETGEAQDNEQLNKTKISDTEGDKNVAGVFQSWDDDDDTWVNDYYLAMTGDFVIRIAEGVTVERGDLLMSAGDGTAKPQIDDAVRSCTVAKVTSTNVTCTYDDGSYCVPCVLMAC